MFEFLNRTPRDKVKSFMIQKIKDGETHEIRQVWDKLRKEETMRIVILA